MATGFTLLDDALGVPRPRSRLWTVIDVAYGHLTDWRLRIVLEDDRETTVWFDDPTSHRVLDGRDLLDYWSRREEEGVAVGTLYAIRESILLDELKTGVTAQTLSEGETLTQYLIAGMDTCVEVIAAKPPTFGDAAAPGPDLLGG